MGGPGANPGRQPAGQGSPGFDRVSHWILRDLERCECHRSAPRAARAPACRRRLNTEHLRLVENCAVHTRRSDRSTLGPTRLEGVYDVHDWAEARRLHRQGLSKIAIANRLGMSRNTASALVERTTAPRYERGPVPSKLDPFV